MTDIQKLKALAEAAPAGPWYPPDEGSHSGMVFDCDLGSLLSYESIDTERDACVEYVAAANPAAALELIAEIERLQEDLVAFKGGISALGEACKKLTFCARTVTDGPDEALMAACDAAENALSLVGVSRAIDYIEELKTENEVLRKALHASAVAMWNSEADMDAEAQQIDAVLARLSKEASHD